MNSSLLRRLILLSAAFTAGCAAPGNRAISAIPAGLWPSPFPPVAGDSLRPELTASLRAGGFRLGLNGIDGLDGEKISRAVALLPRDRGGAGVIVFEIERGTDKGVHRCEALGRGLTSLEPRAGWIRGTVREDGGRAVTIYYAPQDESDGATVPGIYDLKNMRPADYKIHLLDDNLAGEEPLLRKLSGTDEDARPFYTGAWLDWYPRDPRYADLAPIDMVWSDRYQALSQGAGVPVFERSGSYKNPEQIKRKPDYYRGPYGRSGTAIHTDRWDDPGAAPDPKTAADGRSRSFLYRSTWGCLKVRADCNLLLNAFVDEQSAEGRRVQLDVRELEF